eukprot:5644455-Prymnesium_polylepis.2
MKLDRFKLINSQLSFTMADDDSNMERPNAKIRNFFDVTESGSAVHASGRGTPSRTLYLMSRDFVSPVATAVLQRRCYASQSSTG